MYYYLRVIAVMFMETVSIASAATSPTPTAGKRASGRLGASGSPSRSTTTAVAVKKTAASKTKTDVAIEQSFEEKFTIGWTTWTALGIAGAGTLLIGTVLPFWLVNLAQQAAQMMLK